VSGHTFEEVQRVGEGVGAAAVTALEGARKEPGTPLAVARRLVAIPMENENFKLLLGLKALDQDPERKPTADLHVDTEVWRVDLGQVTWISIPGEVLPRPALALKAKMPGKYRMIVALGNDELGYILDPEDFDRKLYTYEKSMSVGKQTWPKLFDAAQELLR